MPSDSQTFSIDGVLLDVEGTTSSVAFVYDVLFPFAARALATFVAERWNDPALQPTWELLARDVGMTSAGELAKAHPSGAAAAYIDAAQRLMAKDAKATGLKDLQGKIWKAGYDSGELRSHVYDDVAPALENWRSAGKTIRIYSSGSVEAQKIFFAHTAAGDLTPYFSGHDDTTTGPKREADSYRRIAEKFGLAPARILFVSDVVAELDAARAAGMRTLLSMRPGNAPVEPGHGHPEAHAFAEIVFAD